MKYIYQPQNLKQLRLSRGLTLEEFAKPLGCTRSAASKWELGRRPSLRHISRICEVYKVEMSLFFDPAYYNGNNAEAV